MGTREEDECKRRYNTAERQCDKFLPIQKELLFRGGRPWRELTGFTLLGLASGGIYRGGSFTDMEIGGQLYG